MSKGINVYDEVHFSFGSFNESVEMQKQAASETLSVFLSHRKVRQSSGYRDW